MSDAIEVADAEIVPDEPQTLEVVHRPRRNEVLRPLDVTQQKEAMDAYQRGLQDILDASDWQKAGKDQFVKKSGWRKIAAWFDLSIELVRDTVERDEHGQVTRACVWARAVAASGRFADGDGYCDVAESRFADPRGRQKLENDLRGTATTRAVNRAISNLVGMGAVSAEEVGPTASDPAVEPASDEVRKAASQACLVLTMDDRDAAIELFKLVVKHGGAGFLPQAAAMALIDAADAVVRARDVEAPEIT